MDQPSSLRPTHQGSSLRCGLCTPAHAQEEGDNRNHRVGADVRQPDAVSQLWHVFGHALVDMGVGLPAHGADACVHSGSEVSVVIAI